MHLLKSILNKVWQMSTLIPNDKIYEYSHPSLKIYLEYPYYFKLRQLNLLRDHEYILKAIFQQQKSGQFSIMIPNNNLSYKAYLTFMPNNQNTMVMVNTGVKSTGKN